MARRPTRPQKEINSILSSFATIRVLRATAQGPMTANQVAEHLGATKRTDISRVLARLRRHALVEARNSINKITPGGRKVLRLATSGLKAAASLTASELARSK